ncbi:MAG: nicotinamide-nucleotide adenylyltransferase [Candidatus Altiarchaeota archaeon]|nr:nicotinamide-nucleotide adenylyltransferase [Candidatus Altiarchaeota archaeon]
MPEVTALLVGRFQPFHNGHMKLIEHVANEVDYLLIAIGSSQESHTWENPFSAEERKMMVQKSLRVFKRYEIYEIPDVNNDRIWVSHVKRILPEFDVVYANSDREIRLFGEAGFEVKSTPLFSRDLYSGTEIRRRIAMDEKWERLVPQGTIDVIRSVDGIRRIKELSLIL